MADNPKGEATELVQALEAVLKKRSKGPNALLGTLVMIAVGGTGYNIMHPTVDKEAVDEAARTAAKSVSDDLSTSREALWGAVRRNSEAQAETSTQVKLTNQTIAHFGAKVDDFVATQRMVNKENEERIRALERKSP